MSLTQRDLEKAQENVKGENTKMFRMIGDSIQEFSDAFSGRLKAVESYLVEVDKKAGRPMLGATDGYTTPEVAEHQKAFDLFLRKGDESGLSEIQQKAMNSGSDPDGGFLVVPEMDAEIDRIAETISPMYMLATVKNIRSAKWQKLVKTAGMAMRRVAEGQSGGETDEPRYSKIEIQVHTAEVEPWVHNETLDDADVDLAADLADEAGTAFAEGAGAEFWTGDGVAGARGILSYPLVENESWEWGSIGYIPTGLSNGFPTSAPADALINLQHALKPKYRAGAVWTMNDSTLGVVRKIKDGTGSYYLFQDDPSGAFVGRLLGHPVHVDDNMADIGAGSHSIAFGNFKRGYTIVNRKGVNLIRDNITQKGRTKFNFTKRFSGGVTHFEAIKTLRFATS